MHGKWWKLCGLININTETCIIFVLDKEDGQIILDIFLANNMSNWLLCLYRGFSRGLVCGIKLSRLNNVANHMVYTLTMPILIFTLFLMYYVIGIVLACIIYISMIIFSLFVFIYYVILDIFLVPCQISIIVRFMHCNHDSILSLI